MKKVLWMYGALLMVCGVAMAVTGDPTQPLFGWNPQLLNFILPIVVPFLVSAFSKLSWSANAKRALLAVLCLIATGAVGWFGGYIVKTDLSAVNVIATFAIVFGVANVFYQLLANMIFKPLAVATDGKKN